MATNDPMDDETEYIIFQGEDEERFELRRPEPKPKPPVVVEPELTEEEKAEKARIQELKDINRIEELKLLTKLAVKFSPSQVSDVKIHIKIYKEDWKKAMTGPDLILYLDELSKSEARPNRFSPLDKDKPPEYDAKMIAGYLFKLGKYELSNEAKWIETITSLQEVNEEATIEHFFNNLVEKLKMNKELFSELRYKANTYPRYVGQILEDLAEERFFQKDLVIFCATLDYKGMFKMRAELQEVYIKSFYLRYTDEEFETQFLRLASEMASTEDERVEDDFSD